MTDEKLIELRDSFSNRPLKKMTYLIAEKLFNQ
jgi:hypothetical protein